MFDFVNARVEIRSDIPDVLRKHWTHLALPGPTLSSPERIAVAAEARSSVADGGADSIPFDPTVSSLASTLMANPGAVDEELVLAAAEAVGNATTVEAISIVAHLSAIDGFHYALGLPLEPLPEPLSGDPTGDITPGLKRRRTHVPMPPGPIPVSLDLTPTEGIAMEALSGPLYMTYDDMAHADFARDPGLNRAQMELISSRTSHRNACFY